jgi:hypothetical protein
MVVFLGPVDRREYPRRPHTRDLGRPRQQLAPDRLNPSDSPARSTRPRSPAFPTARIRGYSTRPSVDSCAACPS